MNMEQAFSWLSLCAFWVSFLDADQFGTNRSKDYILSKSNQAILNTNAELTQTVKILKEQIIELKLTNQKLVELVEAAQEKNTYLIFALFGLVLVCYLATRREPTRTRRKSTSTRTRTGTRIRTRSRRTSLS